MSKWRYTNGQSAHETYSNNQQRNANDDHKSTSMDVKQLFNKF